MLSTAMLLTISVGAAPTQLTPGLVLAQANKCTDGKVISVDTAGHCCWAGQAWSNSRNTCVGVPTKCPAEKKLEGDACVTICEPGKSVTADTAGRCCWPAQVWSTSRKTCVGIPQCPAGLRADGEQCAPVCPSGQLSSPETAGNCCWPAQVWSTARKMCVGIPQCPAGLSVSGESCVGQRTQAAPAPPALPSQAPQSAFALPLPPPPPLSIP